MKNKSLLAIVIAAVVLLIVAFTCLFTVHQTRQAIVLQFGNPLRVVQEPGLHLKLPWQNVEYFDQRVLDYAHPGEEVIAADQKRLVVDSYMRYQITDPLRFYQTVGFNEAAINARLSGILNASLRRVIGESTLNAVLSEERADIMARIREGVNEATDQFGIDVIDVRIRRADLPQANAEAIFRRMQSEREREAREFRAQGEELAQRIRSRADRERTVLIAEAQRQSQALRGEGDGQAIRVYAEAFGRDPAFYGFYRSMEAYRNALADSSTTMVLNPNSEFFRYFGAANIAPGSTGLESMLPASAAISNGTAATDTPAGENEAGAAPSGPEAGANVPTPDAGAENGAADAEDEAPAAASEDGSPTEFEVPVTTPPTGG